MVMLRLHRVVSSTIEEDFKRDLHGQVVGSSLGGGLASDEATPGFMALVDDLGSILLVLCLAREGEGVLGLSIGDLVNPE